MKNQYSGLFREVPEIELAFNYLETDLGKKLPKEIHESFKLLLLAFNDYLTSTETDPAKVVIKCHLAFNGLMGVISGLRSFVDKSALEGFKDTGICGTRGILRIGATDPFETLTGYKFSKDSGRFAKIARSETSGADPASGSAPVITALRDYKRNIPILRLLAVTCLVAAATVAVLSRPEGEDTTGKNVNEISADQEAVGDQVETVNSKAGVEREERITQPLRDKVIAAEESAKQAQAKQASAEKALAIANEKIMIQAVKENNQKAYKAALADSIEAEQNKAAKVITPSKGGTGACANLPEGVRKSIQAWAKDGKLLTPAQQQAAVNALIANGQRDIVGALGAGGDQINPRLVQACLTR